MDDIVKQAIKKWPNVPHCYGWMALDARGDWYLRDEPTQAAGPFPAVKGSRVVHDKLKAFIHRNYECDERGAWFFQNGPQRVYVQLEAAPLVLGLHKQADGSVRIATQTDWPVAQVRAAYLDELGRLYLDTEHGLGLVRSLDMEAAADALESGMWDLQEVSSAALPSQFGFLLKPEAP